MNFINYIFNFIFDLLFFPFSSLDPIYGLCFISLLTSIITLPIFKYTSNQEAIKKTKTKIMAHFLEVILFKDDIKVILSAQKNILRYNAIYLKYMIKPLMFIMAPVIIIIIQIGIRYEYRPFLPGEVSIVKVKLGDINMSENKGTLLVPDGLKIEIPSLRFSEGRETYWRIRAEKEGSFDLQFKILDKVIKKKVIVGNKLSSLSSKVSKGGFLKSMIYPAEPLLSEDSVVELFEVKYPFRQVALFGWNLHWLIIFFILSLAFSFLLLKPFNVRI